MVADAFSRQLDRHHAAQRRKRIERDRRWLSRNRPKVMRLLRRLDGDICLWCGKGNDCYRRVDRDDGSLVDIPVELAVDHVLPPAQGGDTHIDNLVLLHKDCNEEKGHLKQEHFKMLVRWHRAERQGEGWDDDIDHQLRVEWSLMYPY